MSTFNGTNLLLRVQVLSNKNRPKFGKALAYWKPNIKLQKLFSFLKLGGGPPELQIRGVMRIIQR